MAPTDAAPRVSPAGQPANAVKLGAAGADAGPSTAAPNPIVGVWRTDPRQRPASTVAEATLILSADNRLALIAVRVPASLPAGSVPTPGCVVSDEYDGTYATTVVNGSDRFESRFERGIVNRIDGCEDTSRNALGVPVGADDLPMRMAQGVLPPPSVAYTITPTMLTLFSPGDTDVAGLGRIPGTAFTRAP